MTQTIEIKKQEERLILVGVSVNEHDDVKQSLKELEELAKTAGGITVCKVIQNRESIHPGTYIGKGKIEEVKILIQEMNATTVVCDDELSPAQLKNLEQALDIKVIDRTVMILDIFAARALTREGKIQVELAQLKYRASRLVGLGSSLSRLGGGIGTRGPGEKKLEMDRRLIKDRISQLKSELLDVQKARQTTRSLRQSQKIPVVAIVGYTNAGKSTLLNQLTGAGILAEDKLFATLDPTTRNLKLESGQQILLTDTVGFIRKLPHHLIEAFKSTLEEAKYADIILHVVDASNPDAQLQMEVVYETLNNLKVEEKPIITAFNKVDMIPPDMIMKDSHADKSLYISAKYGSYMSKLLDCIEEVLLESKVLLDEVLPYSMAGFSQDIRKYGQLISEEYVQDGIHVKAYVTKELFDKIMARKGDK